MIECLPSDLEGGRELGGVRIELLHPEGEESLQGVSGMPLQWNDRSLVLRISYGRNSFLFPGDLENEGEAVVVSRKRPVLRSDVLLAPHHGSRRSSSLLFLQEVKPRFCVISARSSSPPRFPHPETLGRLEEIGCRILRIDRLGAITFSASLDELKIGSHRGGLLETASYPGLDHRRARSEKEEIHEND